MDLQAGRLAAYSSLLHTLLCWPLPTPQAHMHLCKLRKGATTSDLQACCGRGADRQGAGARWARNPYRAPRRGQENRGCWQRLDCKVTSRTGRRLASALFYILCVYTAQQLDQRRSTSISGGVSGAPVGASSTEHAPTCPYNVPSCMCTNPHQIQEAQGQAAHFQGLDTDQLLSRAQRGGGGAGG